MSYYSNFHNTMKINTNNLNEDHKYEIKDDFIVLVWDNNLSKITHHDFFELDELDDEILRLDYIMRNDYNPSVAGLHEFVEKWKEYIMELSIIRVGELMDFEKIILVDGELMSARGEISWDQLTYM